MTSLTFTKENCLKINWAGKRVLPGGGGCYDGGHSHDGHDSGYAGHGGHCGDGGHGGHNDEVDWLQLKGERLEQERRRDQAERILEVSSWGYLGML